jgi:hypothetical protein
MSRANVRGGALRSRNELAKLGIDVAVSSAARYMVRERKPPSPSWRAFLDNHVKVLVAVDFFVVPTAMSGVPFGFLVLAHDRRRVVHFNVTAHHLPLRAANRADEPFGKHRRRRLHLAAFLGPTGWPAIVPTELVCWILAGQNADG